jgi:plastocyanin
VVLAGLVVGGAPAGASAASPAPKASVKKKACPVKRSRESKRARVARRACVKRRRAAAAAARKPVAVKPPVVVVPAPVAGPVVALGEPAGVPAPVSLPAPVASTLGVDAFDIGGLFTLRLTRVAIPVGTVTIYYRNRDVSEHNLWIDGPGDDAPVLVSGAVGENATATKRVDVGAGAWRLFCSLPGHEAMSATITVG